MRNLTIGLLGAAALAATLLLVRQQRQPDPPGVGTVTRGENQPTTISLERMREAGL